MLPLAQAAQAAGHSVLVLSGPEMAPLAEAAGIPFSGAAPAMRNNVPIIERHISRLTGREDAGTRLNVLVFDGLIRGVAATNARGLLTQIHAWQPELIVTNLAEFAGSIAAATAGIPTVIHGFGPQPSSGDKDGMLEALDEAAAAAGMVSPVSRFASSRYVDIWPLHRRPAERLFEHPLFQRPEHALVRPGTDGDADAIYVTFGTTHRGGDAYVDSILDGAIRTGRPVVATVGAEAARLADRRSDAVRIYDFLPQDQVLPRSAITIHHGGSGTALGALSAGVPMLIAPLTSDHHVVAESARMAGVAETLEPSSPDLADQVMTAVQRITETPSYRLAARETSRRIWEMPSPSENLQSLVGEAR
jgi:UDP:flavonoid glycosyltransferase YjiC (YdhE family)